MELLDTLEDKARREMLVKELSASGITSEPVLNAIRTVPRHFFVSSELREEAYLNSPLPIGEKQTISQPYVVARMTELIFDPSHKRKVLEIGTGSGYQAAILAQLYDEVYTVERIQRLLEKTKKRFQESHCANIHAFYRDGYAGYPEAAPYDAIIVTAATAQMPDQLLQQLSKPGRLVVPLEQQAREAWNWGQFLTLVTKSGEGIQISTREEVRFVPMLGGLG